MANMLLGDVEYVLVSGEYGRETTITVVQRSANASKGREYWTYEIQGHLVAANKPTSEDRVDAMIDRLK